MDQEFQSLEEKTGAAYWKSLDELAQTDGFREWAEREFPQGASELSGGFDRRHFMKIMAASFGLAGVGLAGCRRPKHEILPYVDTPEDVVPGQPQFYSTSRPTPWENMPVVAETHGARPTKLEGNPSVPGTAGGTDIFTQASVLDLYDPSRAKRNRSGGSTLSRAEALDRITALGEKIRESGGEGVAFLAEPSTSPSRRRMVAELRKACPALTWAEYQPIDYQAGDRAATRYYGRPSRVQPHFDRARRILAVDCDFLGREPGSTRHTRAFSASRRVDDPKEAKRMNRLYAVEGDLTLTGAMADHRLKLAARHYEGFLAALARALLAGGESLPPGLAAAVRGMPEDPAVPAEWVEAVADDLRAHRGEALVAVGTGLPERCQFLGLAINEMLGAPGSTLSLLEREEEEATTISQLANALQQGSVNTLVILGGNPVYNAPANLDWPLLQQMAGEVVRLGYWDDETSVAANTFLLTPHYLEEWSDGETREGTLLPVQPMIEPLMDSFPELEVLARLGGRATVDPYEIVRETFQQRGGGSSPGAFQTFLATGVLPESGYPVLRDATPTGEVVRVLREAPPAPSAASASDLCVQFRPSNQTLDGRFANNGWMLECPDPMSKLTWDNAILISPQLGKQLEEAGEGQIFPASNLMNETGQLVQNTARFKRGKEQALMAELTVNGATLRGPVHVLPGLDTYTVVVPIGFGRTAVGPVGQGSGFDAYPAIPADNRWNASGGRLQLTGEVYELANTQEHWSMEGRALLREGSVDEFAKKPDFVSKMSVESHSPPIYGRNKNDPLAEKVTEIPQGGSMYKTPEFTAPQQWGMSIDLNVCTGCNACVIACQSENNIPIVGKDQVLRGREMHWIRLDRYFATQSEDEDGLPDDVQVAFQGMACVHCELAPCETVCPVNATVHDSQGLNVMAYNRCVGTRYCANNCPYKVRRFNFFDWNKREIDHFYEGPLGPSGPPKPLKMQKNPDVTVRMRGVMEKCTFCVQRIQAGKINQLAKAGASSDVLVPDGTIKTACQQVCPAEAIVFGDVADPTTRVSRAKESPRDYAVLGYLNTRPRTTYQAKLRNPNPAMPSKYRYSQPFGRRDYEQRYGHGGGHGKGHAGDDHGGKQPAAASHGNDY